ncbi:MAG: Tll0287-like domain-containing protein [Candidatus Competibacteraceae bacterium]
MKSALTLTLTLVALLLAGIAQARQESAVKSPDALPEVKVSRAAAQQFGGALKEALQQAMQNGGPVNGIAVCHDKAKQIATDQSWKSGVLIGRTSLKIRNSANAPDNWELAVLRQFEARKIQGEPADKLEFFAVIDDDKGQKTFRYMKAIPTVALCLNCHGETLSPEVAAKLKELYPNDQAHGFKEGDLRGAFTIAKPLP